MSLQLLARRERVPIRWSWGHCRVQRVKLTWREVTSVHFWSHLRNRVINKSCSKSLLCLRDFLCLIVNYPSFSHFPFSLCQWSDSKKNAGAELPTEAVLSAYEGSLTPGTGAGDIMELVNFKSFRFTLFLWYILQKPTPGREGPVASLLHCRRVTLAFQSIYYEIKWIPLGLIPCCNCNEKKQFLTLHLRSITIKIH